MRVMMHGSWRISTALLLCINTCTSSIASSLISNSRDVVFDPLVSSPLQQDLNDSISFPIDRQFTFPRHFRLDEPFTITLKPKEALFVPLKPIHGHLFPSSSHATDVAIALELSACKGTALTYIATTGSTTYRRFSQARYQCLTISNATDAQHHNLCPTVHDDDDITLRQSPTTIDGFVLRAQIGHSVDIIAVLRSTAQKGAYTKAFFVPDVESSLDFNISYAIESSQVSFSLPQTWEPTQQAPVHEDCQGCEFAMYAEMVPPVNSSVVVDDRPPLPYCLARQGGVKYKLPSPTTSSGGIQQVTLPESFADEFSISGDYRFVLVASLPAKTNNGHTALLTYRPTRAKVTAPTHYTSHILIILGVVVVVASIGVAAAKSEQVKALWERASGGDHDDESVQLLAQAIADQAAEDDDLEEHKEEEPQPPSLLEAIRKTQAQHTTPQPSPRPTAVQRDGYEEII